MAIKDNLDSIGEVAEKITLYAMRLQEDEGYRFFDIVGGHTVSALVACIYSEISRKEVHAIVDGIFDIFDNGAASTGGSDLLS